MKAVFDDDTYKKIGRPDLNSRIFIKRGNKKYYGLVHTVAYLNKGVELRIKVDKIKEVNGA